MKNFDKDSKSPKAQGAPSGDASTSSASVDKQTIQQATGGLSLKAGAHRAARPPEKEVQARPSAKESTLPAMSNNERLVKGLSLLVDKIKKLNEGNLPNAFQKMNDAILKNSALSNDEKAIALRDFGKQGLGSRAPLRSDESILLYQALASFDDKKPTSNCFDKLNTLLYVVEAKEHLELHLDDKNTQDELKKRRDEIKGLIQEMEKCGQSLPDTFKTVKKLLSNDNASNTEVINNLRKFGAENYVSCKSTESKQLCEVIMNIIYREYQPLLSDLRNKINVRPSEEPSNVNSL